MHILLEDTHKMKGFLFSASRCSSSCVCIASGVLDYRSPPCKTDQLEPCSMRYCAASVPAFGSHGSKTKTFAVEWSAAILRSLSTEHAAATALPTVRRLPCSLSGTVSETDNSLWQHVDKEWQQRRQGRDYVQAWHIEMLIAVRRREF